MQICVFYLFLKGFWQETEKENDNIDKWRLTE